jgi:DNA-directed RNA polymerase subunit M
MEFCEKCGTRLRVKQVKMGNESIIGITCDQCGSVSKKDKIREKSDAVASKEAIKILGEESNKIEPLPTTSADCPKCDNSTAYWWLLQTRGADEGLTHFFRCTKCNHTWRIYS